LGVPHLAISASWALLSREAYAAACLCCTVWAVGVTTNEVKKAIFKRQRPAYIASLKPSKPMGTTATVPTLQGELPLGAEVVRTSNGTSSKGVIIAVDREADDTGTMEAFYTVRLEDGREVQTTAARLVVTRLAPPPKGDWLVDFQTRLKRTRRFLPQLQVMMQASSTSHASFPSGDAAGAASIMAVAYFVRPSLLLLWVGIALVAAFGRVYFHAHHLFDVIMGQVFAAAWAWVVFWTADGAAGEQRLGPAGTWLGFLVVQIVTTGCYFILQKLKKH